MKKIFYLASIAALALSSCTKDETTDANLGTVTNGSKIVAAMEADDTRTELVKNGNAYDIVWKSTDGLSVYEKASNGGTSAFSNRLFQLDNASDGLASGAFTGSALQANGTYVAVYPYDKAYTFSPNWNKVYYNTNSGPVKMLDPQSISVNIPAEQEYVGSGTFNTNTIPAVSTSFVVGEDGNATVKMQPVVDYVMVDIVSTEPIESVSLELYKGSFNNKDLVKIAGTTKLDAYYANGGIRYVTDLDNQYKDENNQTKSLLDKTKITLVTKDLADDVSLAKANTYVFAIPGGILGMNKDIRWMLSVNGKEWLSSNENGFNESYLKDKTNNGAINTQLNAYYVPAYNVNASRVDIAGQSTIDYHYVGSALATIYEYSSNLENTVFYLNASKDGQVLPFTYNPNGDVLIENEVDLFDYFANYGKDGKNYGDAYVKEGAIFDLSVSHMTELIMEIPNNKEDQALREAISVYIATNGSFPAIAEYKHQFNGNGATIANIERPLSNMGGLFGDMVGQSKDKTAKVSNLILSNVDAATVKEGDGKVMVGKTEVNFTKDYNGNKVEKETLKGVVLANSIGDNASISNITVSELNADAVLGNATIGNFNAIKIGEEGVGEELNHIVATVTANVGKSYEKDAEGWEAVSAVAESVFHTIKPAVDSSSTATHHVITLPEGADHTELACAIDNEDATAVLSVTDGKVSYWTGAKKSIDLSKQVMGNKYGDYKDYGKINFAEELASLNNNTGKVYINTDMVIEAWESNNWVAPTIGTIYGADHTISNIVMEVEGGKDNKVAPFVVSDVQNVVLDGISILIKTDQSKVVPSHISGLSNTLTYSKNVTINDLVINAYILDANGNEKEPVYGSEVKQRFIGWLKADATSDIAVYNTVVNGVESNVAGLAGMIGRLTLQSSLAYFNGSYATDVTLLHEDQEWIDEFEYITGSGFNAAGAIVAYVNNYNYAKTASIKFDNFGSTEPIFLYRTKPGTQLNVIYNDTVVEELLNPEDEE